MMLEARMTQFCIRSKLTDLADEVAYHAMNVAQGVMDVVVLVAVGLVIAVSGNGPAPQQAQVATVEYPVARCAQDMRLCITQQVLQPQGS